MNTLFCDAPYLRKQLGRVRDGNWRSVHFSTLHSLRKRGLVTDGIPARLTEAGHRALEQAKKHGTGD